jgi:Na+-transporting methylmalonyl-CoA/oxaloacetate decarboxylase gamma subunit
LTLSIWDTMAIAGFIVLWLFLLMIVLAIIGGITKKSRQKKEKDELYEKVMKVIKTDEDFTRIVRNIQKENDDDR